MSVAANQYDKFMYIDGEWEKINETVDEEFDEESSNAISNSTVTNKINELEESFPTIVNNLDSTSTTSGLSANMGRVLKETIGDISSLLDDINGEVI